MMRGVFHNKNRNQNKTENTEHLRPSSRKKDSPRVVAVACDMWTPSVQCKSHRRHAVRLNLKKRGLVETLARSCSFTREPARLVAETRTVGANKHS
jgi:hypothetical protein